MSTGDKSTLSQFVRSTDELSHEDAYCSRSGSRRRVLVPAGQVAKPARPRQARASASQPDQEPFRCGQFARLDRPARSAYEPMKSGLTPGTRGEIQPQMETRPL